MQKITVLGEERHLFQTKSVVHFSIYGVLPIINAAELYNWGHLDAKSVTIFPMAQPIILFKFSKRGKKAVSHYKHVWEKMYVPALKLETAHIENLYEADENRDNNHWGFSQSVFDHECCQRQRKTILPLCPTMDHINTIIELFEKEGY